MNRSLTLTLLAALLGPTLASAQSGNSIQLPFFYGAGSYSRFDDWFASLDSLTSSNTVPPGTGFEFGQDPETAPDVRKLPGAVPWNLPQSKRLPGVGDLVYLDKLPKDQALLIINVPEGAEVYLQGVRMEGGGTERRFLSPKLKPGQSYSYRVKAIWVGGGNRVSQEKTVSIEPGQSKSVSFIGPGR